jgi:hypothetical protein
VITSILESHDE